MCLFEPICMPEAVAVPSFVANPTSSSLFMWFVFHEFFLFEDPVDPVMADVNFLFVENLF